jgi:SAM-dependent methyltransferase
VSTSFTVENRILQEKDRRPHCIACGSAHSLPFLQTSDRFHGDDKIFFLRRCQNCSHVWLENPPTPRELGRYYGPLYDRFISRAAEHSPGRWERRKKSISVYKSSGALLDLGCGSGSFLEAMKNDGWKLSGIEMSEDAAGAARNRTGANVFSGDILSATFPDGTFDVITCFDVLEHVYDPRKVLSKVSDWLKPGGVFYTLVPNIDSGEARFFESCWYGLELPRHLSHFCPDSLRRLAESAGLTEISLETNRNSALDYSLRYVNTEILSRFGISRRPLAEAGDPTFIWKALRMGLRWSVYQLLYRTTALAGAGESIHAFFQKTAKP